MLDRLERRGMQTLVLCVLCKGSEYRRDHLFFSVVSTIEEYWIDVWKSSKLPTTSVDPTWNVDNNRTSAE